MILKNSYQSCVVKVLKTMIDSAVLEEKQNIVEKIRVEREKDFEEVL